MGFASSGGDGGGVGVGTGYDVIAEGVEIVPSDASVFIPSGVGSITDYVTSQVTFNDSTYETIDRSIGASNPSNINSYIDCQTYWSDDPAGWAIYATSHAPEDTNIKWRFIRWS